MRGLGCKNGLGDLAISAGDGRALQRFEKGGPAPLGLRPHPPEFSDQKNEGSGGEAVT